MKIVKDQNKISDVETRHSKKVRIEKSFGPDFLTYMLEGEPQTYKEAVDCVTPQIPGVR